jgi:hypothetical protein
MQRLGPIAGRSDTMVKLRGVNVFPEAIGALVVEDGRGNGEFLCVVEREGADGRDVMRVDVESAIAPGERAVLRRDLEARLSEALGVAIRVEVVATGALGARHRRRARHQAQAPDRPAMSAPRRAGPWLACALMLLALTSSVAGAQTAYPNRSIRLLVGYPPGGATDIVARILAQKLGERLGQPVVVDNLPGAGGIIATDKAAKAAPDGYTLLLANTAHGINPSLYKSLPYDAVASFAPVIKVADLTLVLVVNPAFPARSVRELDRARQGTARRAALRVVRRRAVAAPRRRADEEHGRRRHRPCPVQG